MTENTIFDIKLFGETYTDYETLSAFIQAKHSKLFLFFKQKYGIPPDLFQLMLSGCRIL